MSLIYVRGWPNGKAVDSIMGAEPAAIGGESNRLGVQIPPHASFKFINNFFKI